MHVLTCRNSKCSTCQVTDGLFSVYSYQILKDAMQCENEHKFCHSCLFIWSTTGQYANRIRCPVCRGPGQYYRNKEVDDQVAQKKVRCHLESCRWVGPLLHFGTHKHTTYDAGLWAQEQDDEDEVDSSSVLELPYLGRAPPRLPHHSQSRFTGTGLTARLVPARTTIPMASAADEVNHNTVPHVTGALLSGSSPRTGAGNILFKDRRTGNTVSVPGLGSSNPPLRLTVRQRVHPIRPHGRVAISHTDDNNNQHAIPSITTTLGSIHRDGSDERRTPAGDVPHTPRPPSGPRPANSTLRRNLPVISSQRLRLTNMTSNRSSDWLSSSSERDSREGAGDGEVAAPDFFNAAAEQRFGLGENLTQIRDRLQESRQRLNLLMSTFSGELERSRQEMADFQIERERQRREQLSEVRELGRRLGQVASELRRLLDQRHSNQHDSSDE